MSLRSAITVDRNETFKGPCYVAIASNALTSFPGEIETVIHPVTYALNGDLTSLCPTSEDGVTIRRVAEVDEGIAIDQKTYNLDEGEPTGWSMEATMTLMDTTVEMLQIGWETPAAIAVTGSIATSQKRLPIGAPDAFTERELYVIQEDPKTQLMRVFAFREVVPQVDSETVIQSAEASGLPITFRLRADPSIAEHHGPFGFVLEEQP